jgi:uncharacterized protein YdhG (YjbR/CyaY superfamily)
VTGVGAAETEEHDMAGTPKARKKAAAADEGLTAQERAAIKERAAEVRRGKASSAAAREAEVLATIAAMPQPDRGLAEKVHTIVTTSAPSLAPRLWYGMPAYAKDGKVLCFFQGAQKFDSRYASVGFNDAARLDEGSMWATAFALTKLTVADQKKLAALVERAARDD